jgi:DNA-binding MarR family transcriptional regulator
MRYADMISQSYGITASQLAILLYISHYSKAHDVIQKELEDAFKFRASSISNALKLIEAKGLIVRQSLTTDARRKRLALSPKGQEICNTLSTDFLRINDVLQSSLTEEELETLYTVIDKLNSAVHSLNQGTE